MEEGGSHHRINEVREDRRLRSQRISDQADTSSDCRDSIHRVERGSVKPDSIHIGIDIAPIKPVGDISLPEPPSSKKADNQKSNGNTDREDQSRRSEHCASGSAASNPGSLRHRAPRQNQRQLRKQQEHHPNPDVRTEKRPDTHRPLQQSQRSPHQKQQTQQHTAQQPPHQQSPQQQQQKQPNFNHGKESVTQDVRYKVGGGSDDGKGGNSHPAGSTAESPADSPAAQNHSRSGRREEQRFYTPHQSSTRHRGHQSNQTEEPIVKIDGDDKRREQQQPRHQQQNHQQQNHHQPNHQLQNNQPQNHQPQNHQPQNHQPQSYQQQNYQHNQQQNFPHHQRQQKHQNQQRFHSENDRRRFRAPGLEGHNSTCQRYPPYRSTPEKVIGGSVESVKVVFSENQEQQIAVEPKSTIEQNTEQGNQFSKEPDKLTPVTENLELKDLSLRVADEKEEDSEHNHRTARSQALTSKSTIAGGEQNKLLFLEPSEKSASENDDSSLANNIRNGLSSSTNEKACINSESTPQKLPKLRGPDHRHRNNFPDRHYHRGGRGTTRSVDEKTTISNRGSHHSQGISLPRPNCNGPGSVTNSNRAGLRGVTRGNHQGRQFTRECSEPTNPRKDSEKERCDESTEEIVPLKGESIDDVTPDQRPAFTPDNTPSEHSHRKNQPRPRFSASTPRSRHPHRPREERHRGKEENRQPTLTPTNQTESFPQSSESKTQQSDSQPKSQSKPASSQSETEAEKSPLPEPNTEKTTKPSDRDYLEKHLKEFAELKKKQPNRLSEEQEKLKEVREKREKEEKEREELNALREEARQQFLAGQRADRKRQRENEEEEEEIRLEEARIARENSRSASPSESADLSQDESCTMRPPHSSARGRGGGRGRGSFGPSTTYIGKGISGRTNSDSSLAPEQRPSSINIGDGAPSSASFPSAEYGKPPFTDEMLAKTNAPAPCFSTSAPKSSVGFGFDSKSKKDYDFPRGKSVSDSSNGKSDLDRLYPDSTDFAPSFPLINVNEKLRNEHFPSIAALSGNSSKPQQQQWRKSRQKNRSLDARASTPVEVQNIAAESSKTGEVITEETTASPSFSAPTLPPKNAATEATHQDNVWFSRRPALASSSGIVINSQKDDEVADVTPATREEEEEMLKLALEESLRVAGGGGGGEQDRNGSAGMDWPVISSSSSNSRRNSKTDNSLVISDPPSTNDDGWDEEQLRKVLERSKMEWESGISRGIDLRRSCSGNFGGEDDVWEESRNDGGIGVWNESAGSRSRLDAGSEAWEGSGVETGESKGKEDFGGGGKSIVDCRGVEDCPTSRSDDIGSWCSDGKDGVATEQTNTEKSGEVEKDQDVDKPASDDGTWAWRHSGVDQKETTTNWEPCEKDSKGPDWNQDPVPNRCPAHQLSETLEECWDCDAVGYQSTNPISQRIPLLMGLPTAIDEDDHEIQEAILRSMSTPSPSTLPSSSISRPASSTLSFVPPSLSNDDVVTHVATNGGARPKTRPINRQEETIIIHSDSSGPSSSRAKEVQHQDRVRGRSSDGRRSAGSNVSGGSAGIPGSGDGGSGAARKRDSSSSSSKDRRTKSQSQQQKRPINDVKIPEFILKKNENGEIEIMPSSDVDGFSQTGANQGPDVSEQNRPSRRSKSKADPEEEDFDLSDIQKEIDEIKRFDKSRSEPPADVALSAEPSFPLPLPTQQLLPPPSLPKHDRVLSTAVRGKSESPDASLAPLADVQISSLKSSFVFGGSHDIASSSSHAAEKTSFTLDNSSASPLLHSFAADTVSFSSSSSSIDRHELGGKIAVSTASQSSSTDHSYKPPSPSIDDSLPPDNSLTVTAPNRHLTKSSSPPRGKSPTPPPGLGAVPSLSKATPNPRATSCAVIDQVALTTAASQNEDAQELEEGKKDDDELSEELRQAEDALYSDFREKEMLIWGTHFNGAKSEKRRRMIERFVSPRMPTPTQQPPPQRSQLPSNQPPSQPQSPPPPSRRQSSMQQTPEPNVMQQPSQQLLTHQPPQYTDPANLTASHSPDPMYHSSLPPTHPDPSYLTQQPFDQQHPHASHLGFDCNPTSTPQQTSILASQERPSPTISSSSIPSSSASPVVKQMGESPDAVSDAVKFERDSASSNFIASSDSSFCVSDGSDPISIPGGISQNDYHNNNDDGHPPNGPSPGHFPNVYYYDPRFFVQSHPNQPLPNGMEGQTYNIHGMMPAPMWHSFQVTHPDHQMGSEANHNANLPQQHYPQPHYPMYHQMPHPPYQFIPAHPHAPSSFPVTPNGEIPVYPVGHPYSHSFHPHFVMSPGPQSVPETTTGEGVSNSEINNMMGDARSRQDVDSPDQQFGLLSQVMKLFESGSPQNPVSDQKTLDNSFNLSSISKQLNQLSQWKRVLDDQEQYLHQHYLKTQHQSMMNNRFHKRQLSPAFGVDEPEPPLINVSGLPRQPDATSSPDALNFRDDGVHTPGTVSVCDSGVSLPDEVNIHDNGNSENLQLKLYVKKLEELLLQRQQSEG